MTIPKSVLGFMRLIRSPRPLTMAAPSPNKKKGTSLPILIEMRASSFFENRLPKSSFKPQSVAAASALAAPKPACAGISFPTWTCTPFRLMIPSVALSNSIAALYTLDDSIGHPKSPSMVTLALLLLLLVDIQIVSARLTF